MSSGMRGHTSIRRDIADLPVVPDLIPVVVVLLDQLGTAAEQSPAQRSRASRWLGSDSHPTVIRPRRPYRP